MTPNDEHRIWVFGIFQLDTDRAALSSAGVEIPLRAQSYQVLLYLLEHAGRLVTKKELLENIWQGRAVTDDSVTHCLIDIRKALQDTDHVIVRTIPRQGYIFELAVTRPSAPKNLLGMIKPFRPVLAGLLFVSLVAVVSNQNGDRSADTAPVSGIGIENVQDDLTVSATDTKSGQPTDDTVAYSNSAGYNAYLQGKHIYGRRGPGDLELALSYFQQAVEIDPTLAPAWTGIGAVQRVRIYNQDVDPDEGMPTFVAAVETAYKLDPADTETRLRYAQLLLVRGNDSEAQDLMNRVHAEDPDHPLLLGMLAGVSGASGDIEAAVAFQRRAVEQDPVNALNHNNLAAMLAAAGLYTEAIKVNRQALALSPAMQPEKDAQLAQLYILLGRYSEALRIIEQCPIGLDRAQGLALAYQALGKDDAAREALLRLHDRGQPEATLRLAEVHSHSGDVDAAFELLQGLYDDFTSGVSDNLTTTRIVSRIRYSPFFRPLHSDTRWHRWWSDFPG